MVVIQKSLLSVGNLKKIVTNNTFRNINSGYFNVPINLIKYTILEFYLIEIRVTVPPFMSGTIKVFLSRLKAISAAAS
jgi:hypothetical protein